ncbi:MAG: DUF1828 domain-containing protein [Clostridia bacterium]
MENIFEKELAHIFEFKNIDNKFWGIKVPVKNVLGIQTIYVKKLEDNFFRIHDGGETIPLVAQSQNVFTDEFENKLIEKCKEKSISKNGNILYIDCSKEDFTHAFLSMFALITLLHA